MAPPLLTHSAVQFDIISLIVLRLEEFRREAEGLRVLKGEVGGT